MLSARILKICLVILSVVLVSCGVANNKESIEALYDPKDLNLNEKPIYADYWGDLGKSKIEPDGLRKLTRAIFGWIPILGDLVELPLDIGRAILPNLPSESYPNLPADAAWNDPRILSMVKSLKLKEGFIRITPPDERGPGYKPPRCWFGTSQCAEEGFSFLKDIRVYLLFKNPRPGLLEDTAGEQVLLAQANTDQNYDSVGLQINFVPTQEDLRPYLSRYESFDVKIIADGKPPRRDIYLDGRMHLQMQLKLDDND